MPIRVAIIEEDAGTRRSLVFQLKRGTGLRLVASYSSVGEAIGDLPCNPVDVVVMDFNVPDSSGTHRLRELKTAHPALQILILTASEDSGQIFAALRAGASGYLLKVATGSDLVAAIVEVQSGGSPMSATIARKVVSYFHKVSKPASGLEKLTPREETILSLLARGDHYKEIAAKLGNSSNTVRNHLHRIYRKLHVQSRTEAVLKFLKR